MPVASDITEFQTAGIVLIGGRSRRMGSDKCSLQINGRTLLQRVVDSLDSFTNEVVVVGSSRTPPPVIQNQPTLRYVTDLIEDEGPLVAIATGLESIESPAALVAACDLPYLQHPLLRFLVQRTSNAMPLVVPVYDGTPQFLCSAWRRELLPAIHELIRNGVRSVSAALNSIPHELVQPGTYSHLDAIGQSFMNVNTPNQLATARAFTEGA